MASEKKMIPNDRQKFTAASCPFLQKHLGKTKQIRIFNLKKLTKQKTHKKTYAWY